MRDIPAFPQDVSNTDGGGILHSGDFLNGEGMTLRDYFAASATEEDVIENQCNNITREQAKYAYADAMLKARES